MSNIKYRRASDLILELTNEIGYNSYYNMIMH